MTPVTRHISLPRFFFLNLLGYYFFFSLCIRSWWVSPSEVPRGFACQKDRLRDTWGGRQNQKSM